MITLALALLLAAAPAAAQKDAAPAQENVYSADILETMKNLAILLEHANDIKPEKLGALAAEMRKLDNKVKDTLGEEILAQAAAKEKELENRARADYATKALQDLRVRLQANYAEQGGVYPADLTALAPQASELYLPEHSRTAAVKIIASKQYDKDFTKAITDSGAWLYFSEPGSANYGMLLLDCSHKDFNGVEFYKH